MERLGASSYAHLSVGAKHLCVAVPALLPLRPGQTLHLRPQDEWVYAFDTEGRSISAGKQGMTACI